VRMVRPNRQGQKNRREAHNAQRFELHAPPPNII
jgi:hypothetical protein